ncbi:MAG: hypothetical protein DRN47_05705 [Candidatus Wolframiiraptor sp.]|nr:MAG: hypothetical protein DRN47_05705 [Candidatus Wolframiiraptor sp.]
MLIYLPEEGICRKYAVTRREGVEHLIERSRRFLETAEYQIDRGFYDLAAFSLEQALQPFLKSRLLENGVKEPFEVHIQPPENAHLYLKRGKFIEIS